MTLEGTRPLEEGPQRLGHLIVGGEGVDIWMAEVDCYPLYWGNKAGMTTQPYDALFDLINELVKEALGEESCIDWEE